MQNKYVIDSVDKALQLIVMLQNDGALHVSHAAEELGVAKSTVHRLLGTLAARGFVTQDERRRYLPGPSLTFAPRQRTDLSGRLRQVVQRSLRRLSQETGETTHLIVRDGPRVRFLDSVEGLHALRVGSRIGVVLPAYVTAGGKALLADLDRDALERTLGHDLDTREIGRVARALAAVRQRGYATNFGETERGVTAIGARVRDSQGSAVAITISAPSLRVPRGRVRELGGVLRGAAAQLESELGRGAAAGD